MDVSVIQRINKVSLGQPQRLPEHEHGERQKEERRPQRGPEPPTALPRLNRAVMH